jgi:hypothetical protein
MPMQRTAQARFTSKGCCLLCCLKLGQIVLAKYVFIDGVFCVVPCLMALVTRAAADWRRWAAAFQRAKSQTLLNELMVSPDWTI